MSLSVLEKRETDFEPMLLTARQAAKLLAVGERTLWRWSRSGTVPAPIKIGERFASVEMNF